MKTSVAFKKWQFFKNNFKIMKDKIIEDGKRYNPEGTNGLTHYSDKGGHKERSIFWTEVKGLAELLAREAKYHPSRPTFNLQPVPIIEQARQIRRQMRRITNSGRR